MSYVTLRLVCSFLSGVLLSQAGSFIQLATRNVLASPSTLGIDGLTVLWIMIFHMISIFFFSISPVVILCSGVIGFILISFVLSRFLHGKTRYERIILFGVTVNLLIGAMFSLGQFFFLAFNLPFPVEIWFGNFRYADFSHVYWLGTGEVFLLLGYFIFHRKMDQYSLGPVLSRNFNLGEKHLFFYFFVAGSIGTYLVVSLFGAFSFLGLIFPILARKFWFKAFDFKGEFLWGAVLNGLVLMLLDTLCYQYPIMGAEVPAGLIITIVGAVSLIFILWFGEKKSPELLAKSRK